jgi:hypothetical protein
VRTPERATQIAAACEAAYIATLQPKPRARAATSVPQKTSPAPAVSITLTSGAPTRNVSPAETKDEPAAPRVRQTETAAENWISRGDWVARPRF